MTRWHRPDSGTETRLPVDPGVATWVPTREAAQARARAVDLRAYGRTRNFLDGAVTRLSPWITHGFVDLPELVADARLRLGARVDDKLIFEYAWREFFHHVWRHAGDAIFADLRPGLPDVRYATTLPDDIATASTGVPVIDGSIRALYADGWLHNHARMWLASYIVHVRKVHWRVGADWMVAYLLDGDLASNHLSWQWCAGTFSHKPYLFNAENVARYAPQLASPGTFVDTTYDMLDDHARHGGDAGVERDRPAPIVPPGTFPSPLDGLPPEPTSADLDGRDVVLVHPWHLRAAPHGAVALAVLHAPHHARFPWSAKRWRFVTDGMAPLVHHAWFGDLPTLAPLLRGARSVRSVATFAPGYREAFAALPVTLAPAPRFTEDPDRPCASFSAFWSRVSRSLK